MRKIRPLLVVIVLAVLVIPSAGWAAPAGGGSVDQVFRWIEAVWSAVWGDNGICIDPDGCSGGGETQAGPEIDPNGARTPGGAANGICVDPNGRPTTCGGGPATQGGCWIDPNGSPVCVPGST